MVDLLPQGQVTIDSGDHFFVENHGNEPMEFVWAKRHYKVGVSKKKLVPFEVIALYFGDPRSVVGQIQKYQDSTGPGEVPERYAEVQRLAVRYGVYEQGMDDIATAVNDENTRLAHNGMKSLRIENFAARISDTEGNYIIPPLFDRDGLEAYGFNLGDENSQDLATIIRNLQSRLDHVEGIKSNLDKKGVEENTDDGIALDNPV